MEWGLIGWIACLIALAGSGLASSRNRRYAFWGWLLWFVGNVCWMIYGATIAALPVIFYNTIRALISLRGARNNKQAIRKQRK